MMRWSRATPIVLVFALMAALGACRSASVPPDSDEDSAAPPASAVTMAVTAERAVVAPIHRDLHLLGATVASRHWQLRAPSAGRVLDFNLQNGDSVRRRQVVAHVLNREVEAAANGLAVAQRLDPAGAPALAQSVKRYSHAGGVAVIAPEDGIVSQRLVSTGQMVNDMDPLAELVDPQSVYVEAAVPIESLASIRPGMEATVTSPMIPGTTMPARIAALSPSFNPNGATSPARIEFTTAERVNQAGAPVEVNVISASVPNAVVIPVAALFADVDGHNHVFVAGRDGRAHRTAVTVGIRSGNLLQITSGVRAGDLMITSGGYALADGLKLKVTVAQPAASPPTLTAQ